jgi:polysaccharide export outer membrane protein
MHAEKKRHYLIVFNAIALFVFLDLISLGTKTFSQSMQSLTIFQPGDAVQITVWELYQDERRDFNLNRAYSINPDGYIIMPIVGEIRVRGLTVYELIQTLEEKFSAYLRNPYIYVRPLIRLTLQGAFNKPGSYLVDPQSSLWEAVAMAGGPTGNCNLEKMRVERGGDIIIEEVLESFERGYSLEEVGIESGDQIIAQTRGAISFTFIISVVNLFASIVLLYLRLRTGRI